VEDEDGRRSGADGYHREGVHALGDESYESTRLTTNCHGRNAWRWNGYRCSDAITTATCADGTEYNGVTSSARSLPRWPLHPVTATLALLGIGTAAAVLGATAPRNVVVTGAVLLLVVTAGAAAGFANSGST